MKTEHWRIDARAFDDGQLEAAAAGLRHGGVIAIPTETVYGLAANALDAAAVSRVFVAKGRPADNPLIVHLAGADELTSLAERAPAEALLLAERFWPGPLTLVLPAAERVPAIVTAGLPTVAVRVPDHPVARALIRLARAPLAAPSANRSGRPSPTTAEHVLADLAGRIDGIVDAGPCRIGLESTVLDLSAGEPVILRPGAVTAGMLEEVLSRPVPVGGRHDENRPRAPGMKYAHYAPGAPLILLAGHWEEQVVKLRALLAGAREARMAGWRNIGLLVSDETAAQVGAAGAGFIMPRVGSRARLDDLGARLFGALRSFDESGVDGIVAETYELGGLGSAVMNRLEKAAAGAWWR